MRQRSYIGPVITLFVIWLATALGVTALLGAVPQSSGNWVLQPGHTLIDNGGKQYVAPTSGPPYSGAYWGHQIQVSSPAGAMPGQASTRMEYWRGYGNPKTFRGTVSTEHRWSGLPALVPGNSDLGIELEAASSVKQTRDIDLGFVCSTSLLVNARGVGSATAGVPSSLRHTGARSAKRVTARIGSAGRAGEEMHVSISIYSPIGICNVRYRYLWAPGPAVPPPSPPSTGNGAGAGGRPPGSGAATTGPTSPGGSGGAGGGLTGGAPGGTSGTVSSPPPPPGQGPMLVAGRRRAKPGEVVTVPISFERVPAVASMNFEVHFDPGIATARPPVARGNLMGASLFEANAATRGLVRIGFAGSVNVGGDGTVAQVPFTATGKPGDRTPLRLSVVTCSRVDGTKVALQTVAGEVLVVGPGGSIPGDSDGDGELSARDAGQALKMSVGLIPEDKNLDLDRDGRVTADDARLILLQVVGK